MTVTRLAQIMSDLFDYLGDDRWDLGELIVDFCEGAEFYDPHTKGLLAKMVQEMPEPDNFTTMDLAEQIRKVGTEFAVGVANDIEDYEAS